MTGPKPPRAVTLADVAKAAGVSRSLASLALRGEPGVLPDKRAHIRRVASALNYRPNAMARNLASAQNRTIGVVAGSILNPFVAYLVQEIDREIGRAGFDGVLSIHGWPDSAARHAVEHLVAQRVAGLILVDAPAAPDAIAAIAAMVPTVYVGRDLTGTGVESITTDDELGGRMVAEHLLGLGHKAIAHIDGGPARAGSDARRNGYAGALEKRGLSPNVVAGEHTIDAGARAADQVLAQKPRPSAIFASNDLMAIGAINAATKAGLRVPEDISIAGFDDMPLADSETLSITTVRQPAQKLAAEAVAMLLSRLSDPGLAVRNVLVAPTLIARRSTATGG